MKEQIINLGESLVKELGLDSGVDTLSRWIVHYIAEQMEIAKKTKGAKKKEANKNCNDTILKLWQHRSFMPDGHRPLENYDPILRTIERMNPENPKTFYYSKPTPNSSNQKDKKKSDEIDKWLDIALVIDKVSRIWLKYVFQQATIKATDKKTIELLETIRGLNTDDDISVIINLMTEENENEESILKEKDSVREKLQFRITQLDAFVDFSKTLRQNYVADLNNILKTESGSEESQGEDIS